MKLFLIFEIIFVLGLIARKLFFFSSLTLDSQSLLIHRWSTNFSFEIINRFLVISLFSWSIQGLTFSNSNDGIGYFIFFVLVIDFVFYWRHRFYHRWFWRFHQVHHSDEGYDFTLSLRIHPIETVIQIGIFLAVSTILNVSEWQFLLAAQIFTLQALVSHFENPLPKNLFTDKLRSIFVMAQDHRHHHDPINYNCNFGFLFSFWDSWFKTGRRN